MWLLSETFLLHALAAAVIAGSLCAFIGVFISLKNIIFVGLALSEVAALGVAAGFFIGFNPVAGAFALTIAAGIFFWHPGFRKQLTAETLIGFAFCFAGVLSIILVSKAPMLKASGLDLLSGNILYVSSAEVLLMLFTGCAIALVFSAFFRKILYASFDPDSASASGVSAKLYDFILYFTLSVTIAVSMRSAGVLFVFGSLIIPPIIGLMLGNRIWKVFVIAVSVAVITAPAGIIISYYGDFPTSPMITLIQAAVVIIVMPAGMLIKRIIKTGAS